ncbi:dynein axonemal light chain 1-like isoform X2 [Physella acuta]|nr:dynein axonemal light chain 1-like isoform X2 [Physella acuta]XP_059170364.1 dynein axonemal light chain 1-like isoform X2 [Physella acuta]XP_059170372.1 dynein axonemal light chain 1-like isoform X2 [Physella acuta]
MSKGMAIKDALKQFEEESKEKAKDAKVVKLIARIPFIDKMDASLSQLEACEHLSLSTNKIEKIANLNGLKHLRVLSIGRNSLKSLAGIEACNDTLQELWCSYNQIDRFKGITGMKKLKVLFMAHNKVSDLAEVGKLSGISTLEDVLLIGNPIEEELSESGKWFNEFRKKCPKVKKLDGTVFGGDD